MLHQLPGDFNVALRKSTHPCVVLVGWLPFCLGKSFEQPTNREPIHSQMLHGTGIFTYIDHKFMINVPRTQMTLVLIGKGLVLEG